MKLGRQYLFFRPFRKLSIVMTTTQDLKNRLDEVTARHIDKIILLLLCVLVYLFMLSL